MDGRPENMMFKMHKNGLVLVNPKSLKDKGQGTKVHLDVQLWWRQWWNITKYMHLSSNLRYLYFN